MIECCPLCNSTSTYEYMIVKSMPTILRAVDQKHLSSVKNHDFVAKFCSDCLWGYNASPLVAQDYSAIYENYSCVSSMCGIGREKYYGIIETIDKHCSKQENIVEIGCYDGYLLSVLRSNGFSNLLGVEPSEASQVAVRNGFSVINNFFNQEINLSDVDCFILSHVYEHFPDPVHTMKLIKRFMKRIAIIEVPYFDGYFHEHLFFFSLFSIKKICDTVGLHIIDFEMDDYFGDCSVLRVVIAVHEPEVATKIKVASFISEEMQRIPIYAQLKQKIYQDKVEHLKSIVADKEHGSIAFWGAGSSAVIFLNSIKDILAQSNKEIVVLDSDHNKWGKFIPGLELEVQPFSRYTACYFDTLVIMSMFYREIEVTVEQSKIIAKNKYVLY